jgi:hypothetical protein
MVASCLPEEMVRDVELVERWEQTDRPTTVRKLAPRYAEMADRYRDRLISLYGATHGAQVRHAEAFEVSEYGARLTPDAFQWLFPFAPQARL